VVLGGKGELIGGYACGVVTVGKKGGHQVRRYQAFAERGIGGGVEKSPLSEVGGGTVIMTTFKLIRRAERASN